MTERGLNGSAKASIYQCIPIVAINLIISSKILYIECSILWNSGETEYHMLQQLHFHETFGDPLTQYSEKWVISFWITKCMLHPHFLFSPFYPRACCCFLKSITLKYERPFQERAWMHICHCYNSEAFKVSSSIRGIYLYVNPLKHFLIG